MKQLITLLFFLATSSFSGVMAQDNTNRQETRKMDKQIWKASDLLKTAMQTNDFSKVHDLFSTPEAKQHFDKQYQKFQKEVREYRANAPTYYMERKGEKITQVFIALEGRHPGVRFAVAYLFTTNLTQPKISKATFLRPQEIPDRKKIEQLVGVGQKTEGATAPMDKPYAPIPE